MKVEIDIKDFPLFMKGLNNCFVAYKDIRDGVYLMGCLPDCCNAKWEFLVGEVHDVDDWDNLTAKFDERLQAVKEVYDQLTEIERREYGEKEN